MNSFIWKGLIFILQNAFETKRLKLQLVEMKNGDITLQRGVQFWFLVAVLGQWFFATYVALVYGGSALQGDFATWNKELEYGFVDGETMNNTAVVVHLFFAVIMIFCGPLQFIPQLRKRFPKFHRWNGRIYIPTAILVSLAGLVMILSHGSGTGLIGDMSISIDGLLIIIFAVLAWQTAIKRKFDVHRKWALRLFLVSNAVWFYRIGLMLWIFIWQRPVGFDPETFQGPFLVFIGFAQYLIPLIVLETYFKVQEKGGRLGKIALGFGFIVMTFLTAIGIFAASMMMWLPSM